MWTQEHRRVHARKGLRYPSDLTDAEWALVNGRWWSRCFRRRGEVGDLAK